MEFFILITLNLVINCFVNCNGFISMYTNCVYSLKKIQMQNAIKSNSPKSHFPEIRQFNISVRSAQISPHSETHLAHRITHNIQATVELAKGYPMAANKGYVSRACVSKGGGHHHFIR